MVDEPVRPTVTEVDGNVMYTGRVKDTKMFRTSGWKRARRTAMPELDTEAEILKSNHREKLPIPDLRGPS
jgi:hypothetical protein